MIYHFDDTRVGKITLRKLSEAAKKGVNVCVMHDVLTSELDEQLSMELKENGGIEHRLNPVDELDNWWNRFTFKRDHEKLFVMDNKVFIGSSNVSDDYARTPTFNYR